MNQPPLTFPINTRPRLVCLQQTGLYRANARSAAVDLAGRRQTVDPAQTAPIRAVVIALLQHRERQFGEATTPCSNSDSVGAISQTGGVAHRCVPAPLALPRTGALRVVASQPAQGVESPGRQSTAGVSKGCPEKNDMRLAPCTDLHPTAVAGISQTIDCPKDDFSSAAQADGADLRTGLNTRTSRPWSDGFHGRSSGQPCHVTRSREI